MTYQYDYQATVDFDGSESDAEQRAWLSSMRAHLLDVVAEDEPIDQTVLYSVGESAGSVMIVLHEDLTHEGKQIQLRRVADRLEFCRLRAPNPMPDPWTTKNRRA